MSSSTSADWEAIGRTANALILYHPESHALIVQRDTQLLTTDVQPPPSHASLSLARPSGSPEGEVVFSRHTDIPEAPPDAIDLCPYCYQRLPPSFNPSASHPNIQHSASAFAFDPSSFPPAEIHPIDEAAPPDPTTLHRTPPYFRILAKAHDVASRPSTPPGDRIRPLTPSEGGPSQRASPTERRHAMNDQQEQSTDKVKRGADGYYSRFFLEEKRLGMGAEGSVFLCQHVLEGNPLGHYAVKKIAVGSSSPYLFKMLREVRLLEALRHPNIIPYHHVWIETTNFSSFGPPIAALHVLMMYANSGNLDTFIEARHSPSPGTGAFPPHNADSPSPPLDAAEMKRRFRTRRASSKLTRGEGAITQEQMRKWEEERRAVMLLSKEEVGSLFGDVVRGLAFLHSNSILHLDLKCSNVLLHLRDGLLIPTAMISDFGTSEEMLHQKRERTGHTGTMEYMAPETVFPDPQGVYRQTDSTADMWSLGLILHKMLFFRLPYNHDDTFTELEREIAAYKGFSASPAVIQACEGRGLPRQVLTLLERLVSLEPRTRPTAEKVLKAWSEMDFDIVSQPRPSNSRLQVGPARSSWIRDPPSPARPIKSVLNSSSSVFVELRGERSDSKPDSVNTREWLAQSLDMTAVKILVAVLKIATTTSIRFGSFPGSLTYYCILILAAYDLTQSSMKTTLALLATHLALSVALTTMGGSPHQVRDEHGTSL